MEQGNFTLGESIVTHRQRAVMCPLTPLVAEELGQILQVSKTGLGITGD